MSTDWNAKPYNHLNKFGKKIEESQHHHMIKSPKTFGWKEWMYILIKPSYNNIAACIILTLGKLFSEN